MQNSISFRGLLHFVLPPVFWFVLISADYSRLLCAVRLLEAMAAVGQHWHPGWRYYEPVRVVFS
jgi:hypothetical protein